MSVFQREFSLSCKFFLQERTNWVLFRVGMLKAMLIYIPDVIVSLTGFDGDWLWNISLYAFSA